MDQEWKDRLRDAIKRSDRSYTSVSQEAGLGQNFVSQILNGERSPSIENLVKVCQALNVSAAWVVSGIHVDDDVDALLKIVSSMSDDDKKFVIEFARKMSSNKSG